MKFKGDFSGILLDFCDEGVLDWGVNSRFIDCVIVKLC